MIFRTFSTDAAKCQQLPLQSPFSFRRLAPAVDYLGSPFSAFFRPLLLGFPLTLSCLLPLSSARPSLSFVRFYLASGYSASCSSFPLSSRFSSQRLTGASSVLSILWFFPFRPGLVSHPFLPVLRTWLSCIVSFRPSQFRSRSRSTGAHPTLCFSASSQMFAHAFRPLSLSSSLEPNYSAFCFSFPVYPHSPHSWLLGFSASPLGSPDFLPTVLPGFPCISFGSQYSASCMFPFILPRFAPTAAPQVLTFFRLSTSLRCSSLRLPFFRPAHV